MDTLNWRILEILQQEGRASYAEIGRIVGLTAPAVKERVQKMEELGIINGYKAIINPEKLGIAIRTVIQFQVSRMVFSSAVKKLAAFPEVFECYRTTGASSLMILAGFTSMHHMERFLNDLLQFGEPVSSIILSHPISNKVLFESDMKND